MSQVEETSYTYAQYRNTFRNRQEFRDVRYILADSNGTHFEYQDALGERRFGVISDLSSFSIARIGQDTVTILANQVSAVANATISPALNDSVLANWRIVGSARITLVAYFVSFTLTSTTVLQIRATRIPNLTNTNLTNLTITPGDLSEVDVTVSNPHGSDVGAGPHGHTGISGDIHPLTDPGHAHTVLSSGAQAAVPVDWMIVHK